MAQDKVLQAVIKLKDEITHPLKGIKSHMNTFNNASKECKKSMEELYKGMGTVGKGAVAVGGAITAGVTAAFATATKSAIEFESAFAGVKKTVDATDTELSAIEKGLKDSASSNVTSKMIGQFLFWLQECKKPVFVVASANSVESLFKYFITIRTFKA